MAVSWEEHAVTETRTEVLRETLQDRIDNHEHRHCEKQQPRGDHVSSDQARRLIARPARRVVREEIAEAARSTSPGARLGVASAGRSGHDLEQRAGYEFGAGPLSSEARIASSARSRQRLY